jgi:hypothetical protein
MKKPILSEIRAFAFSNTPVLQKKLAIFTDKAIQRRPGRMDQFFDVE